MTSQSLVKQYLALALALDLNQKKLVTLLALHNDQLPRAALADLCRYADIKDDAGLVYDEAAIGVIMARLTWQGIVTGACAYECVEWLVSSVFGDAIKSGFFEPLCDALTSADKDKRWMSHKIALGRLRMALLQGLPPKINHWMTVCEQQSRADKRNPLINVCGAPLNAGLIDLFPLEQQEMVLSFFLRHAKNAPEGEPSARAVRAAAEKYQSRVKSAGRGLSEGFALALAELLVMCGPLETALKLIERDESHHAQFLRNGILLLRGDAGAQGAFDVTMKSYRKLMGKGLFVMPGICGHMYILAMLRSDDPALRIAGDDYLDQAMRAGPGVSDLEVHRQMLTLRDVRSGKQHPQAALQWCRSDFPMARLFFALLQYWLGLPQQDEQKDQLLALLEYADRIGFHLISAQVCGLLGRIGDTAQAQRAVALRAQYGIDDMSTWFARQEPWERKLAALVNFHQGAAAKGKTGKDEAEARLVWLLSEDGKYGVVQVEPREQKRDARGNWSKGRALGLKRLCEASAEFACLTAQDKCVIKSIRPKSNFVGGHTYEIHVYQALAALVGHPLVFWLNAPTTRVELLPAELELLIKEDAGELNLRLRPTITEQTASVIVSKETPTRLRVLTVSDEHRRIGEIIGNGLSVPLQAKEKVLQVIGAISSVVTVQSDIGAGAANVAQVEADQRLHIHLLPHRNGLRMQALVRPLPDGGPYCTPGQGAENVIAEIDGTPMQAHRDLARESRAERQLIAGCPVLEKAEQAHGEWLLDEPEDCLELLLQLQERPAESLLLAWPEGQKFKVGARHGAKQFRMSIKGERDWFAAGGELQVDEQKVLDLRQLLELLKQSHGRFLKIGENEFLALTEEFHRRLSELAALGELHGKGVRVHALAAFALEDLANSADGADGTDGAGGGKGGLKADKLWKQHLARLREVEAYAPQLPGTLQAELRDYQLAGFEWLARLAHWGVGACLADDMGLGKTLQALALILHRAPQGPTLVVAPTSVCMNWMGETARFAPTLNVVLFGGGDRKETLAALQPFDLVIASYGLLQQEAEMFATVGWHTIVLDEAQAIKNAATKRSQAVMALNGGFRMVATGTPLENHLGELWNLFRFINPGLLGSLEQFNQRFAGPIERLVGPPGPQAQENRAEQSAARARLRRLIQPFILRRTKSQVLSELPSRTEILLQVDLSPEETALYQTLRRSALERLAGLNPAAKGAPGQQAIQILAEIMKLRRACCNPQLVAPELGLPSSKLAAFAELLDELLENKHKVLVFSQFVDHLSLIRAHLDQRAIGYQYLDGATPMLERKKRVDAFQGGDGDVFLISLKAGGMGINLTAADYVIHMDPWWNPAVEDQASDRAHRMGQTRPVTIYRLVARHTIEETIVDLHKHKRDLADSLLEGSDVAARLSTSEMMAMLAEGLREGPG